MDIVTILLILVGLVIVVGIIMYNQMIALRNNCQEAWSDIQVQLKRRYNLIPNLVKAVQGYAAHEKEVFEKVTKARSEAMENQGNPSDQATKEKALDQNLKTLFAVSENYPELKADANFRELMNELTDTEDKIAATRRFYNMNTRALNIKIDQFPWSLIAPIAKAKKREYFQIADQRQKEVVEVNMNN